MTRRSTGFALLLLAGLAAPSTAQTFRTTDSVTRRMWRLGMDSSRLEALAQPFIDSIGPRLYGTAGFQSATEWIERTYQSWGVTVRREPVGTWRSWNHGAVHIELTRPRVQNLEVELLAWSPGTG